MVVELAAVAAKTGLDDVNIFAAHRVLDLAAALPRRELGQNAVARRESENVAHTLHEGRMRVPAEDHDISNHDGGAIGVTK